MDDLSFDGVGKLIYVVLDGQNVDGVTNGFVVYEPRLTGNLSKGC
jgi:hypothetical protein